MWFDQTYFYNRNYDETIFRSSDLRSGGFLSRDMEIAESNNLSIMKLKSYPKIKNNFVLPLTGSSHCAFSATSAILKKFLFKAFNLA
jgi:hypothetical protein